MSKRYLQQEEEQGLLRLPIELIKDINERLSGKDLANLASVCSLLDRIICSDNALWKRKFRQEEFEYMPGEIYSCKAWKQRFAATYTMYKRKAKRKLAIGSDYVAKRSIGHWMIFVKGKALIQGLRELQKLEAVNQEGRV